MNLTDNQFQRIPRASRVEILAEMILVSHLELLYSYKKTCSFCGQIGEYHVEECPITLLAKLLREDV